MLKEALDVAAKKGAVFELAAHAIVDRMAREKPDFVLPRAELCAD
jgi:hypothetical protein